MKHLSLIVLLFFFAYPVLSQDAAETLESHPVAIVTQETASVIECAAGATCNVNEAPETPVIPSAGIDNLLAIVGAFILGIVGGYVAAGRTAKAAYENPLIMMALERAFSRLPEMAQKEVRDANGNIYRLVTEATDGVPMIAKPKPEIQQSHPVDKATVTNIHTPGGEHIGGDAEFQ